MDIKTSRPELNEEQKKAAYSTKNAVVAAGAGSGKTFVLAKRFAWLLTEKGFKVDEILTLTFTKKAAAQMFRRIYSIISEIAQKETGLKAQRAQTALDNFIHARIQTLDSYSASIVKQSAPRYGISPDFQLDQDRCYNIALEVSYPFFITHRRHPAIERLYSINRPNDIVRSIFADVLLNYCHIDNPREFLPDVKTQFDTLCVEWETFQNKIEPIINKIKSDILENDNYLPDLVPVMDQYIKENHDVPKSSDIRKYFDLLLACPTDSVIETAEAHPLHKNIISFLLSFNSIVNLSLRFGIRSENPVKQNIKLLREMGNSISSLAISCLQGGFILSIVSLLAQLQDIYNQKKRAEKVLTFKDVANLSRTILINQEDIRQGEKEAFKAIMIDEFQDNNELQKDILFLLAEKLDVISKGVPKPEDLCPDKLFFVGDEKQSIYLFRGADVSVFRKLKEELNSDNLPLKINYRSSSHLISAFNKIFGRIEPDSPSVFAPPESLPPYEAAYSPLEAVKEEGGSVNICILNKKAEIKEIENEIPLTPEESEARFVAEKISILLKEKYEANDIAILFRTRASQYLYEKHLRSLGIPYSSEDINDLFFGGLVNDIMSVLRLAAHPMDKAAYAEMLRSPFAGLSLSGTAVCLSLYGGKIKTPFNDETILHLGKVDKKKYLQGREIYLSICSKAGSESISSLVSELWYKEGYRYETEWNQQTSVYREFYDYLFHLAANADADNQGLASFTDKMVSFREENKHLADIEIPLERPSAVHLMTIHKSKGLEFPVVFLCSCGKKSQNDSCDVVYLCENAGLVFSPPPPPELRHITGRRSNFFWQQENDETRRKRTAELRRLLYVGMTRAEKELYISGSLDIEIKNETGEFTQILKNQIEKQCENNEIYIEGDSIINNDTFFGLFLPAIVSHIPDSVFFNIEEIKNVTDKYIKREEAKSRIPKRKYNRKNLSDFIKKARPYYKRKKTIKTPVLKDNHITPVSLKKEEDGCDEILGRDFFISKEFSGEKSDDIFDRIDSILTSFPQNEIDSNDRFNFGSFGTIAHVCVEARLTGEEPVIPSNISGLLAPGEFSIILEAGNEIAYRFADSPLGIIAKRAAFRESEFKFRSIVKNKKGKEIFVNGTIDLFFEDDGVIHIVDFKTDNRESPGEHTAQMTCYYHAIYTLFAKPSKKQCRVWLYYLRSGHAVEMTDKTKQFQLEQKAFL